MRLTGQMSASLYPVPPSEPAIFMQVHVAPRMSEVSSSGLLGTVTLGATPIAAPFGCLHNFFTPMEVPSGLGIVPWEHVHAY